MKIQFHQNSICISIYPEQLMVARKAGAKLVELHQRAYADEFPPVRPMDPRILL